ncbi:MAG: LTA synthase family protein, partial [bacterium]
INPPEFSRTGEVTLLKTKIEFNTIESDYYGEKGRTYQNSGIDPTKEKHELDAWFEERRGEISGENAWTGVFEGKNLIMICAEALGYGTISKDLTPTLYRMMTKGFNFTKFYQPAWGGSTTTGEFSMLMGLCPRNGIKSVKNIKNNNNYFTMGNQLQRLGYYNACYHNGSHTFYSRNQTHTNLGYRKFLAYGNGLDKYTNGGWKGDEALLSLTLDNYIDKRPFSVYYMSVSGHAAYKKSSKYVKKHYKKVNEIVGNKYKETTKWYLCYQYELELALKAVIKKLEKAGIADDTVICMTGDHYPYGLAKSSTWGNTQNYIKDLYGSVYSKKCWGRDRNYGILWCGSLENKDKKLQKKITVPCMSLDLTPTLSNLFGVEYDSRLMVGRDVFSDEMPLVFWNNNTWVTERGKYDAPARKFYPNKGYEDTDSDYITRVTNIVKNKRAFSLNVVQTDYYRLLFGKDTKKGKAIYSSKKKSSKKSSSKKKKQTN